MTGVPSGMAGPRFRIWPPVAFGVPLFGGLFVSWAWGDVAALPSWSVPAGFGVLALFALWAAWGLWTMASRRTGIFPGQETTELITSGPFRISRNPLYVAMVLGHVGLALALRSTWALAGLPLAILLVTWGAIVPEEGYLRQRFGAAYDAYAKRVRRWL